MGGQKRYIADNSSRKKPRLIRAWKRTTDKIEQIGGRKIAWTWKIRPTWGKIGKLQEWKGALFAHPVRLG
jgi:hypothetical protein